MFDESFRTAWKLRYGEEPLFDFPELASFLRHRSVRHFSSKPVPQELIQALVACAQSAATSSNLQLYSLISIQDPRRRDQMARLCADQHQIREASWFFAFIADHHRLKKAAERVGEKPAGLEYTEFYTMAAIDAALAAERMVCAAESIGLGICYIGALRNNPEGVKDLLQLPDGTFGLFGLCLGYPAENIQAEIKPRLAQSAVWFREVYDPEVDVTEYDERMKAFYASQNIKGSATWSMRSGRRVDGFHMSGRDTQKEILLKWGFIRR